MTWTVGRRAMIGSLVMAHVWGSLLIVAVFMGKESDVIGRMFEGVGFMIFTTLGVLVGGKAWKDFAPLKWGPDAPQSAPPTTIKNADHVEVSAAGDVKVGGE
jgi:hypothetical protein